MKKIDKPNITEEDKGSLYTTNGKDVWVLDGFIKPKPEPEISFCKYGNGEIIKRGLLSEFKDFRRLAVVGELPKPPRKTRSDKGVLKKKTIEERQAEVLNVEVSEVARIKSNIRLDEAANIPKEIADQLAEQVRHIKGKG